MRMILHACLVVALIAPAAVYAEAQSENEGDPRSEQGVFSTRGAINDDLFTSGGTVDVDAEVAGDVFAAAGIIDVFGTIGDALIVAAGEVNSGAQVSGDAIMAGARISVDGSVGDNLVIAGCLISVDAPVAGKLIAAGCRVRLGREGRVADDVVIRAAQITLAGRIDGDVRMASADVLILGEISGNVIAEAEQVEIGPDARIGGTLTVKSPEPPVIHEEAVITGEVTHVEVGDIGAAQGAAAFVADLGPAIYLIVLAVLLGLIAPALVRRCADRSIDRPLVTLGVGVVGLAAAPVILLVLLISVIGIPFALIGLAAFLAVVMFAVPLVSLIAAHWYLRRRNPDRDIGRWRIIGLAVLALILLYLIGLIPYLGTLLWLSAYCAGAGAAAITVWQAAQSNKSAVVAV